ncbi:putative dehydrogenase [Crenobacter luteus]|uniref:oxidoreductase n=1 Tax=Crenobacter luteus TaxID=1452487 RepID=UPI001045A5AA|nr:oxidoreductase [Crenobacter luteus]TCP10641.1 putative dehydrogenase [Crenobacter luteus]
MQEPVRVGLVGYGASAKTFHAPLIAATEGLELVAASSRDAAKVHADFPGLAVESSAEALMARDDVELVVIPTPNDSHFPLALAALAAGKHVVVDKPFTVTVAEAETLAEAARQAGRVLSVFHNRRWDADFLTVKALIDAGRLGRVVAFESRFDRYRPQVPVRWRESADSAGTGLWYDLGPHLIDQALQLFGPPDGVFLSRETVRDGAKVDDAFRALLRYPRLQVVLSASALMAEPGARFAVHGSDASFVKHGLDGQEAALKAGRAPGGADWGRDARHGTLTRWRDGAPVYETVPTRRGDYPAYYAALRDAIRAGSANPVSADEAIAVMRVIEAGCVSAAEGREVTFAKRGHERADFVGTVRQRRAL